MNVRGLQWNHVCFTSFREVSWDYERFAQQCTQWNFPGYNGISRGGPSQTWPIPTETMDCIKKVLFTRYFRYGTLVRTELRTVSKTYENLWKLQSGLWSNWLSWLFVTARNITKPYENLMEHTSLWFHWAESLILVLCQGLWLMAQGHEKLRLLMKAYEMIRKLTKFSLQASLAHAQVAALRPGRSKSMELQKCRAELQRLDSWSKRGVGQFHLEISKGKHGIYRGTKKPPFEMTLWDFGWMHGYL